MSDTEAPVETPVAETEAPAPVAVEEGPMEIGDALPLVLRDAIHVDGIVRGLREVCKALSQRCLFAVIANDCDDKRITQLVEALCAETKTPVLSVDNKKKLGEWAGLCKLDEDGQARKVVKCSCVVVTKAKQGSRALNTLEEHFKSQQ
jgi:small subunit ribosomal protein S12e